MWQKNVKAFKVPVSYHIYPLSLNPIQIVLTEKLPPSS